MAVSVSVPYTQVVGEGSCADDGVELVSFREEFYRCLSARSDAVFELTDALLCSGDPVTTLVDLSLTPEHRRGHGALYDGLNCGRVDIGRLRRAVGALPLPRSSDGRIVLAIDISPWLRPDAPTSSQRAFCHVYGRGKNQAQLIPGWPYSFVAALEVGRTSWTAVLDAVRLRPDDDETTVTTAQVREVVGRLQSAGHWRDGDPDIVLVFDAGYELARMAFLLADLPVQVLGRMRSDRVLHFPRAAAGSNRAPTPARCRIQIRRPPDLARTRQQHRYRHRPLRNSRHCGLESVAPEDHSPWIVGRPPGTAADRRRHGDPADGRSPARRPASQTGVALVLTSGCGHRRYRPIVADVSAALRYRAHVPVVQADVGLDRPEDPQPRGGRPMDLDRPGCAHPTPARPAARRRPTPSVGTTRPTATVDAGPRPSRVSAHPRDHAQSCQCTETQSTRSRTPPGSRNRRPAQHHHVGKRTKIDITEPKSETQPG